MWDRNGWINKIVYFWKVENYSIISFYFFLKFLFYSHPLPSPSIFSLLHHRHCKQAMATIRKSQGSSMERQACSRRRSRFFVIVINRKQAVNLQSRKTENKSRYWRINLKRLSRLLWLFSTGLATSLALSPLFTMACR